MQEQPAVRTSLKARLAEKKEQVAGHGRDTQENIKNKKKEVHEQ